jgi:hypothetical protein
MLKRCLSAIAVLFLVASCAQGPKKDYSAFYSERPRSILIVPVVNNTVDVDAPRYFLATVTVPLAERGYYTFPINLVRGVMDEEGLSDANLVHQADPTVLGAMFGADAILYITIEHWETVYVVLSATTTVSFKYVIKSGRTGETLWQEQSTVQYTPGANSGGGVAGLVAMAVAAAIQKVAPNYMPLAKQANLQAIWMQGKGLPAGPYRADYGQDSELFPGEGAIVTAAAAPIKRSPVETAVKTASVSPATCAPSDHIDVVRDRRSIESAIAAYAETVGFGSASSARKVEKFDSFTVLRDDCGTSVVRAALTLRKNEAAVAGDQIFEFSLSRTDTGFSVTGCKNC